jgi:hypothetical protein
MCRLVNVTKVTSTVGVHAECTKPGRMCGQKQCTLRRLYGLRTRMFALNV